MLPLPQADYDTAIADTYDRRPVSVKVKQFSLQGATIHDDRDGPHTVSYKNQPSLQYIVVVPSWGHPIKIAGPHAEWLAPVHEGIRRAARAHPKVCGHGRGQCRAAPGSERA